MDIQIERATPKDAQALLEYLKQIGSESDNLSFGAEGLPFSVQQETAYLTEIESSNDSIMLVAKVNGKIVGSASLDRLPRRMSHRGEFAVSVLREYWNLGIGGRLTNQILLFAKENNFEIIDLQVRGDNLGAIHLYEKCGFQKIGTHPWFFKIGEGSIPVDYMSLQIK